MFGLADRFNKGPGYSPGPGHYEAKSDFGTKGSSDLTTQLVQKLYNLPNDPLNLTSISVRSTRSTHFDDQLAARVARLETSLNCNRTGACAPGRKRGGGPSGVMANTASEFESANDAGFQRHSWLAGELAGDVFCYKSMNTPANIGPGSYCSPESTAPEKLGQRSHNYMVQRSEEIARNRRDLWIQRRSIQQMRSQSLMASANDPMMMYYADPHAASVATHLPPGQSQFLAATPSLSVPPLGVDYHQGVDPGRYQQHPGMDPRSVAEGSVRSIVPAAGKMHDPMAHPATSSSFVPPGENWARLHQEGSVRGGVSPVESGALGPQPAVLPQSMSHPAAQHAALYAAGVQPSSSLLHQPMGTNPMLGGITGSSFAPQSREFGGNFAPINRGNAPSSQQACVNPSVPQHLGAAAPQLPQWVQLADGRIMPAAPLLVQQAPPLGHGSSAPGAPPQHLLPTGAAQGGGYFYGTQYHAPPGGQQHFAHPPTSYNNAPPGGGASGGEMYPPGSNTAVITTEVPPGQQGASVPAVTAPDPASGAPITNLEPGAAGPGAFSRGQQIPGAGQMIDGGTEPTAHPPDGIGQVAPQESMYAADGYVRGGESGLVVRAQPAGALQQLRQRLQQQAQ
ncbi:unnamed protein product [Amoebophrya sp. A25]|nr:unnamed protein product [Amoebophrya sp. A25]|eukprot:GSA25T00001209001.1